MFRHRKKINNRENLCLAANHCHLCCAHNCFIFPCSQQAAAAWSEGWKPWGEHAADGRTLPNRHRIPGIAALGASEGPDGRAGSCWHTDMRGSRLWCHPALRTQPLQEQGQQNQCWELFLLCSCHTVPH